MKECKECEYVGYSPELCKFHTKSCKIEDKYQSRPISSSVRLGIKTITWAGMGVAAVFLGTSAISLIGGGAVIHAAAFKLSLGAGLAGGGIGLARSIRHKRSSEK